MEISKEEEVIIRIISKRVLEMKNMMIGFQMMMPESIILPIINGAIIGVVRDAVLACQDNDLTILAKYWLVSTITPEKEIEMGVAPSNFIAQYRELRNKVLSILEENDTEIVWPDFNKI